MLCRTGSAAMSVVKPAQTADKQATRNDKRLKGSGTQQKRQPARNAKEQTSDQQAQSMQPQQSSSGFKAVKNKSLILIYLAACLETMWLASHEARRWGGVAECVRVCVRASAP